MSWKVAILFVVFFPLHTSAQSSPPLSSELSLEQSKKLPPFPPKDVTFQIRDDRAVVEWSKIPSDRITGYVVYRSTADRPLKKIGTTKQPPFVDTESVPNNVTVRYAVAAVDYNNNEGRPRIADRKYDSKK